VTPREVVEQTATAAEAVGQALFGEIELAEVLGLLRPVRAQPHPRGDGRTTVALAAVLDGHRFTLTWL